jgi:adenosylmethionine-8-amino-7-oxononanoate aminotransferase
MASEETRKLLDWDREHVIHPAAEIGVEPAAVIDEGYGIYIKDTDGKEYIDGASQLTCTNLGYSYTEIADVVAEQMKRLPYTHSFGGNCSAANIKCSRDLAELTPKGLKHFFYTLSGSDSIDTAFRIARTYWY